MRTTIDLDDDLVKTARVLTGLKERSALVREALKALVEREAARRLAALGGASPAMERGSAQEAADWKRRVLKSRSLPLRRFGSGCARASGSKVLPSLSLRALRSGCFVARPKPCYNSDDLSVRS